ncbi:MAG: phage holin family protein [Rhodobacteraceae bacterium]|nr:phage holin family protein [Paracoccaceae bacterium]
MADPNTSSAARPGTGDLIGQAIAQGARLFRREMDLAQAEIDRSLRQVTLAIGLIGGGAILALTALEALTPAMVAALTELGLTPIQATLCVGGGLMLLALVLLLRGLALLRASRLAPKRTLRNIRKDGLTLKEAL